MDAAIQHIAVTIRADDRSGMDADALAEFGFGIQRDVGEQHCACADFTIVAHVIARVKNCAARDLCAFTDNAVRPDISAHVNLRRARNDCAGVNSCGQRGFREEECEHFGESDAGILHADQHFAGGGSQVAADDDGGGSALLGACKKLIVFSKSQIAGLGNIGLGEAF